jgi:hypothetical protein
MSDTLQPFPVHQLWSSDVSPVQNFPPGTTVSLVHVPGYYEVDEQRIHLRRQLNSLLTRLCNDTLSEVAKVMIQRRIDAIQWQEANLFIEWSQQDGVRDTLVYPRVSY